MESISYLRIERDVDKVEEASSILRLIDNSVENELFLILNIYPSDYFEVESKVIFNKLLNFSHKSNDIFLTYYMDIREKDDEFDIKLTSLRIIVSAYLKLVLNSPYYMSISIEMSKNYLFDIEVYILKDMLAMGYHSIPRFRYYNKIEKKMHYVDEMPIREQIDKLTISRLIIPKLTKISLEEQELLQRYSNVWWNKYCEFINTFYYDIRHLFEFYQGVCFKFVVCKSTIESNYVDTKSGLVLHEIKSASNDGLSVEIDNQVYDIYFLDFDDTHSVLATLGYTKKTIAENKIKDIEQSVEIYVNNELLDIIRSNDNANFFDSLTDIVLGLHGYNKYKFDSFYIKRDLVSDEPAKIEVIKYAKNHDVDKEEIQLSMERYSRSKFIFVHEGLFLPSLKKEFSTNSDILLLDSGDLFRKLKYMLNESILSMSIFNDFIKPVISTLQLDSDKVKILKVSESLIYDIQNCPTGIENWKKYEDVCYRAIRFLFEDGFACFQLEYQISNDIRTDKRDLILQNSGYHDFWKDMKLIYKSNNIVIEFKNYSDSIDNDAFRQISDYLEKDVYGQFGMIFTRKDLNSHSRRKQIDYLLNRNKKLILVISDVNLIDMIALKSEGESPENILMKLKFSLETSV